MTTPSRTTRPIASAQVICGSLAMPKVDEGVQPEPGGQREREVGDHAHQDGHHAGHQGGAGGDEGDAGRRSRPRGTGPRRPAVPMISGFSTTM